MYDELIKRLRECVSGECWNCSQHKDSYDGQRTCADNLMKQAADAIEELRELLDEANHNYDLAVEEAERLTQMVEKNAQSRWIPVTERLPKEADGMVFVLMPDVFPYNSKQPFVNCNQDRRIDMAHYSEHSKMWYFGGYGAVGCQEPIAWIHRNALPEQPKEE